MKLEFFVSNGLLGPIFSRVFDFNLKIPTITVCCLFFFTVYSTKMHSNFVHS